jgi:hypothetical protein
MDHDDTDLGRDPRQAAQEYRIERLRREHPELRVPEPPRPAPSSGTTAQDRAAYVETAIQQAIRRGDFDDLPGAGKPLAGLGAHHDPDWWIRRKIQTEKLTGLGPPALVLRVVNSELDARLDALAREDDVREVLDDFNRRIVEARRQLLGGPPVVTPTRDVAAEIVAWRERRAARMIPEDAPGDVSVRRRRRRRR